MEVEAADRAQLDEGHADSLPEQEREHEVDSPEVDAGAAGILDGGVKLFVGDRGDVTARGGQIQPLLGRRGARLLRRNHGRHVPTSFDEMLQRSHGGALVLAQEDGLHPSSLSYSASVRLPISSHE